VPIDVVSGVARVHGKSTIAGSTATMDRLFRALNAGAAGLGSGADAALVAAVQMTAATPARVLGLERVGALRVGADANLVVLDRDLRVTAVLAHGGWLVDG
jgi:N-acetylglucosamine-6-phosphate deacetylase